MMEIDMIRKMIRQVEKSTQVEDCVKIMEPTSWSRVMKRTGKETAETTEYRVGAGRDNWIQSKNS